MMEGETQELVKAEANPFAKRQAEGVNAGTVAIEEARATAEVQAKLFAAKKFPRDEAAAYQAVMDACRRPALADVAMYAFPRGDSTVRGPSIRLAEVLAASWGNILYGLRELSRKPGVSEMQAFCWDLQTNTESVQTFTVRHERDTRNGKRKLTDERDIYEVTANDGARRMRARILAVIPPDLVDAAIAECARTLAGDNSIPLVDRVRRMVANFADLGVSQALIEKRMRKPITEILPDDLADLYGIYRSIKDEMTSAGDWFDTAKEAAGDASKAITEAATAGRKAPDAPAGPEGTPKKK